MSQSEQTDLYHLHVYFMDETAESARKIRESALQRSDIQSVGRFHDLPVGPHPVRQFQLLVAPKDLAGVEAWLETVRGGLDVLIHPEIDDDLLAHTELARWLGTPHALKLERFR